MLKQADDFYEECLSTYDLLNSISENKLFTPTLFKKW